MKINFKYLTFLFLVALFVFPNFTNAQYLASDILGQLDGSNNPVFTTSAANNGEGVVNARGFFTGRPPIIDFVRHRLFLPDANARVLVFNLDENNNLIDRVADYVIGQADFSTGTTATTQNGFLSPQGLAYDSVRDRLFVADNTNRRVLVFDTSTITNGMNASYVLGQPGFVTGTSTLTRSGMAGVVGVEYDSDNDRLFVDDSSNNRVLVFDTSVITNGMDAAYVLGQPDFTTNTGTTTQNGLISPQRGLIFDSENDRLFLTDSSNRRVLIFDLSSGITNNMNASYVLGQTLFTTNTSAVAINGFATPLGLSHDVQNNRLFVADDQNSRVLVFNVDPDTVSNGANAVAVLGQVNFTSNAAAVTQSGFNRASGGVYDPGNNRLYVSDFLNSRVLIFDFVKLSTTNPTSATQDSVYSQSLSTTNSQGTVSYTTTSGTLPTGLSLNTSTGEISGTPTVAGTYNFTVQATDDNGAIGYFLSQPQEYTLTVEEPPSNSSGSRPRARNTTVPVAPEYTPTTVQVVELTTPSDSSSLTRTLHIKDIGEDVKALQQYLNTHGYPVAIVGPGSLGNETTKFGLLTHAAVVKFQLANKLVPDGIVGPLTRGFLK